MSVDDLNAAINAEEEKLTKAEDDFKDAVAKLQAEYRKLSEEKDATVASVKSSGLGVMKSVLAAMSKDEKKDEL
jgi:aspartate aminotransferase-like enzyme